MKNRSLIFRFVIASLGMTAIFVVMGIVFSIFVIPLVRGREGNHPGSPVMAFAYAVDARIGDGALAEAAKVFNASQLPMAPKLFLVDAGKRLLSQSDVSAVPPLELSAAALPATPYEVARIGRHQSGPIGLSLIRLERHPDYYLLYKPHEGEGPERILILALVLGAVAAAIASSLASFMLLFGYLRKRSDILQITMAAIRAGDLKKRVPIDKLDEVGHLMLQFNEMADELERLILKVRETDRSRVELLQELGHDLRTPLASLRMLSDTLSNHFDVLPDTKKKEIAQISSQELAYLTRLIEDLQFLAQVDQPEFEQPSEEILLRDLLTAELSRLEVRAEKKVTLKFAHENIKLWGNPHLLRRLFRNALDNAFSFARSNVEISVEETQGQVRIFVRDDGPGFKDEIIAQYGLKRPSRARHETVDNRISLGLGSVIMRAIVSALRGSILAENYSKEGSPVAGACVRIEIPNKL